MKHFMEIFVCFWCKQALWRHDWEEKSTGPNELSVQFYYAPRNYMFWQLKYTILPTLLQQLSSTLPASNAGMYEF